jgi:hypothetical protein
MRTRFLMNKLDRIEEREQKRRHRNDLALDRLRADPTRYMTAAGMVPDPWQRALLSTDADRILLLCSRQAGKSTVAAALALKAALSLPGSPVLLLSPSIRQSTELFRRTMDLFAAIGRPIGIVAASALRLELTNGSRIISLPGTEGTVRGFSGVSLLIIDEAARVSDALYYAVRPMLAVSRGRLAALSTPFGQRGWFHQEWSGTGAWKRVKITAPECPRISAEFLAEESRALGERWYRQEYLCSFEDVVDAVFAFADIQAALSDEVKPLFAE